jgi:hypothetical protein
MAGKAWSPERLAAAYRATKKRHAREQEGLPPEIELFPYEDRRELQRMGYASHEDPDTYD